jgi:4-amino-4-deoxy-L-arabinose transferase-like glycosyltransferase
VVGGVYDGRALNAMLAAGTAVLLVVLVSRLASRRAGLVAGLVFAFDPYCLRHNNRAQLETETMLWVVAGYVLLLALARDPLPRRAALRAAGAGLCFGLAILTKEHSTLITVLPMLLALALNWGPPRRLVALTTGVAMACYGVYVSVVAAAGHLPLFWDVKTYGIRRLLGLVQETGFNAPRGNSLSERLYEELPTFWPTYLLLALGPVAFFLLLRHRDRAHRLLVLFHLSAGLTLGYALALGTLEEQFLYLLVVPNLAAVTVAFSEVVSERPAHGRRHDVLRAAAAVLVVAVVTASGVSYARSRTQTEDGYAQMRSYMTAHVPRGSTVISADGVTTRGITGWVLRDVYEVKRLGPHPTEFRYLVVPWKLIEDGYGRFTPEQLQHIVHDATLLHSTRSDMYGTVALYLLPPQHLAKGQPGARR